MTKFKENCQFLNLILSHYIEENELKLQIKVWLSEILALADNYTKNLDFIQFFKDLLQELGKNKFSLEELGILEPKVKFPFLKIYFIIFK